MKNLRRLNAELRIVTPMFLGDAYQKAHRIREASLKGALAFWWRALNYSRYLQEAQGNHAHALAKLQSNEQRLFGGAKGQGLFLIKVNLTGNTLTSIKDGNVLKDGSATVGPGARYLGYGLMGAFGQDQGKLQRSALVQDQTFSVTLLLHKSALAPDIDQLAETLRIFGLLGGLGSRVRRGWGSVALIALSSENLAAPIDEKGPATREAYIFDLQRILNRQVLASRSSAFPLTAFARDSDIRVNKETATRALAVLDATGKAMQRYRAWGFSNGGKLSPPKVNGKDSEMNFAADHHWFKGYHGYATHVPQRIAFGLPQNYNDQTSVYGRNEDQLVNRRASPLLIHVHRTSDGRCFSVLSILPTQFLPRNQVSANGSERSYAFDVAGLPVLQHFLSQTRPGPGQPPPFQNGPYLSLDKIPLSGSF